MFSRAWMCMVGIGDSSARAIGAVLVAGFVAGCVVFAVDGAQASRMIGVVDERRFAKTNAEMRALYAAIAQVESDRGQTSGNVYQLTPEYIADVNRIQRKEARVCGGSWRRAWTCEDAMDAAKSEAMMAVFWAYYARRMPRGGSLEELAKIHHVGHRGMRTRRAEAEVYWRKVKRALYGGGVK